MLIDSSFDFGIPALTDNTRTVSPTVYDAGAAAMLFGGKHGHAQIKMRAAITSATAGGGLTADFIAADNAGLTSNPISLGSSGPVTHDADGGDIGDAGYVEFSFAVAKQVVAKRYYGIMFTASGTSPAIAGSVSAPTTDQCYLVLDAQTNMIAKVNP